MATGPFIYDPERKTFVERAPSGERFPELPAVPRIAAEPRPRTTPHSREKVFFWILIAAMGLIWLVFLLVGREQLAATSPAPAERKPVIEKYEEAEGNIQPAAPRQKSRR